MKLGSVMCTSEYDAREVFELWKIWSYFLNFEVKEGLGLNISSFWCKSKRLHIWSDSVPLNMMHACCFLVRSFKIEVRMKNFQPEIYESFESLLNFK